LIFEYLNTEKYSRSAIVNSKHIGTVVWFSARKGFGFLKSDDFLDEKDIFVHWSGIDMEGYKQLKAGDKVQYSLKSTPKGVVAVEVVVLPT
jgi:CspA family cold shock protein